MRPASVRMPAVAGLFYPGNPQELRAEVATLLAKTPMRAAAAVKAVIAPHAGFVYSGTIAAAAFARLRERGKEIARVVVIGPAHYVALRGVAVPSAASFATPLGAIAVDRDALDGIAGLPCVVTDDAAHAPEHALEVELPFLQMMLGDFKLIPLVVGDVPPQEVAQTLSRVWGGAETLVVISSDLSHYHDYDSAKHLDAATAGVIERGEWGKLCSRDACGYLPIAGFLLEAAQRGLRAERLAMCNSGDSAGDRARVVGYGAWAFQPDSG